MNKKMEDIIVECKNKQKEKSRLGKHFLLKKSHPLHHNYTKENILFYKPSKFGLKL